MIAPGEMEAQFSFKDYVSAFGAGVTVAGKSFFLPFLLLGTIGVISGQMRGLFSVASAYAGLHFVALPHSERDTSECFTLPWAYARRPRRELGNGVQGYVPTQTGEDGVTETDPASQQIAS
jgi:hypothetical protein